MRATKHMSLAAWKIRRDNNRRRITRKKGGGVKYVRRKRRRDRRRTPKERFHSPHVNPEPESSPCGQARRGIGTEEPSEPDLQHSLST